MIQAFKKLESGVIEINLAELKDKYYTLIGNKGGIVQVEILSCAVMTQDKSMVCRIATSTGFKRIEVAIDPQNLFESLDEALMELQAKSGNILK